MLNISALNPHQQNEKPAHKYIMIREPLDKLFNNQQFQEIKVNKPGMHIRLQYRIFHNLLRNEEIFNKYFEIFYENHVKLYHWYLLSRENHHQIQPYIFKKLLKKTIQNYRNEMKSDQEKIAKEKQREKELNNKIKLVEQVKKVDTRRKKNVNELSQDIFNFMSSKTATASLKVFQKPWSYNKTKSHFRQHSIDSMLNKYDTPNEAPAQNMYIQTAEGSKQQIGQSISNSFTYKPDFHELYMQTFYACDGQKYIFYDYAKHMKGLSEKDKYNLFIRKHKGKDLGFMQPMDESRIFKELKSYTNDMIRSSFQFSPYGSICQDNHKKKSKIIFRKIQNKNCGKFIRK